VAAPLSCCSCPLAVREKKAGRRREEREKKRRREGKKRKRKTWENFPNYEISGKK
jgi:hypothetical protein